MVPFGYAVDLYDSDGFSSDPYTVDGPFYTDPTTLKHACVSLYDKFNDRATSLEVYKTSQLGQAKGYWRSITQTETVNFTVHYGMHSKQFQAERTTQEVALGFDMKAGFSFLGGSINLGYA